MWMLKAIFFSNLLHAAPQSMEMIGYAEQTPVWKIELKVEKKCEFTGRHFSTSKVASATQEGETCSEITKQLSAALKETEGLPVVDRPKVETLYTDEESFVFAMGNKSFQVPFQAPRSCKFIPASGKLDCKDNQLTASQKLLLLLRPTAREMKFIR